MNMVTICAQVLSSSTGKLCLEWGLICKSVQGFFSMSALLSFMSSLCAASQRRSVHMVWPLSQQYPIVICYLTLTASVTVTEIGIFC